MATSVKLAHGTKIKRGDGAGSETFTEIAEAVTIGAPNMTRATVDATSHGSTGAWREYIGGLRDAGEVTIEANYLPGNATQAYSTGLGADYADGLAHNYQIVLPSSLGTFSFAGIVTAYNPALPLDGKMGLRVTIKITGAVSFA